MPPGPGRVFALVLCMSAGAASTAVAQDEPRFALVASFPSPTVSFQWEVAEKFALRFEGSYGYTHRDEVSEVSPSSIGGTTEHVYSDGTRSQVIFTSPSVSGSTRTESTIHSSSVGVAGIFSMYRSDQVRLYLAPRLLVAVSRQRTSTTLTLQVAPGVPSSIVGSISPQHYTEEESSASPGAGVSFGAAATVHRHLVLFGEAGFTYGRTAASSTSTPAVLFNGDTTRTTFSTRAVAGGMFLF